MAAQFGLGKAERLKSRKQIEELFARGKRLSLPLIRVSYQFIPGSELPVLLAGFTASKRSFKKAVDRNRIKRLLREAYRLQKNGLAKTLEEKEMSARIFFMYSDRTLPSFAAVQESMNRCLKSLEQKLRHKNENLS